MTNRFANGAKAFGFCDRCNFRFPLKKLKNEVIKGKRTAIKSCPQCWSPDHPQLMLGTFPVADPQALRDPRPDRNTWYQSGPDTAGFPGGGMLVFQWGWAPVGGAQGVAPLTPNNLVAQVQTGTVSVS